VVVVVVVVGWTMAAAACVVAARAFVVAWHSEQPTVWQGRRRASSRRTLHQNQRLGGGRL